MNDISDKEQKSRELQDRKLREATNLEVGQTFFLPRSSHFKFQVVKWDKEFGHVTGILAIFLPKGSKIRGFDDDNPRQVICRYSVMKGDLEVIKTIRVNKYSPIAGLEGWKVDYDRRWLYIQKG